MKNESVVVGAVHPKLGQLYWWYVEEDTGMPDSFGLTSYRPNALVLRDGWREHEHLWWKHRTHLGQIFDPDRYGTNYHETVDDDCENLIVTLTGTLADLQSNSGQSVRDFRRWVFSADWVDILVTEDPEQDAQAA